MDTNNVEVFGKETITLFLTFLFSIIFSLGVLLLFFVIGDGSFLKFFVLLFQLCIFIVCGLRITEKIELAENTVTLSCVPYIKYKYNTKLLQIFFIANTITIFRFKRSIFIVPYFFVSMGKNEIIRLRQFLESNENLKEKIIRC